MLSVFSQYLNEHTIEEIEETVERLTSKEVLDEIEKMVIEAGFTTYQVHEKLLSIDGSNQFVAIYILKITEKEVDEYGTWDSSYLTTLVVR